MQIKIVKDSEQNIWDAYVKSNPLATPYHLFAWRKAVENAYGHKCIYLYAEEMGKIKGIIPIIFIRSFFSVEAVALPFCDQGNCLSDNLLTGEMLIKEALAVTKRAGGKVLEIRNDSPFSYALDKKTGITTYSHKVKMLLALPSSSEELLTSFRSKLRSQIKRSIKNNLAFVWGNIDRLDDFYAVLSRNMRDLGSPAHSKSWFSSILKYFGDNAMMGIVYYDKTPIGAGIILKINKKVSIPWASTVRNFNSLAPNMFLYWNFLKYAADNGYKEFDFGRSTPDEGTYRFKRQWGAKPFTLHWTYITLNNKKFLLNTRVSKKKRIAISLWKRLPIKVSNFLGPKIRKYISL